MFTLVAIDTANDDADVSNKTTLGEFYGETFDAFDDAHRVAEARRVAISGLAIADLDRFGGIEIRVIEVETGEHVIGTVEFRKGRDLHHAVERASMMMALQPLPPPSPFYRHVYEGKLHAKIHVGEIKGIRKEEWWVDVDREGGERMRLRCADEDHVDGTMHNLADAIDAWQRHIASGGTS